MMKLVHFWKAWKIFKLNFSDNLICNFFFYCVLPATMTFSALQFVPLIYQKRFLHSMHFLALLLFVAVIRFYKNCLQRFSIVIQRQFISRSQLETKLSSLPRVFILKFFQAHKYFSLLSCASNNLPTDSCLEFRILYPLYFRVLSTIPSWAWEHLIACLMSFHFEWAATASSKFAVIWTTP